MQNPEHILNSSEIEILKNNLMQMAPRPFGEKFGEWLVFELEELLEKRKDGSHDGILENKKVEIKISRAKLKPSKNDTFFKRLVSSQFSKFVNSESTDDFDCNIQQVKPNCFDTIIYGVFFEDIIYLFKTTNETIVNDRNILYSDKQHRGNVGEGQFHVKRNNLQYHIDNFLYKTLNYQDLLKMIKL